VSFEDLPAQEQLAWYERAKAGAKSA
jgi:hypothetical protein